MTQFKSEYDDRPVYDRIGRQIGILVGTSLPVFLKGDIQGWSKPTESDVPAVVRKFHKASGGWRYVSGITGQPIAGYVPSRASGVSDASPVRHRDTKPVDTGKRIAVSSPSHLKTDADGVTWLQFSEPATPSLHDPHARRTTRAFDC